MHLISLSSPSSDLTSTYPLPFHRFTFRRHHTSSDQSLAWAVCNRSWRQSLIQPVDVMSWVTKYPDGRCGITRGEVMSTIHHRSRGRDEAWSQSPISSSRAISLTTNWPPTLYSRKCSLSNCFASIEQPFQNSSALCSRAFQLGLLIHSHWASPL